MEKKYININPRKLKRKLNSLEELTKKYVECFYEEIKIIWINKKEEILYTLENKKGSESISYIYFIELIECDNGDNKENMNEINKKDIIEKNENIIINQENLFYTKPFQEINNIKENIITELKNEKKI